MEINEIETATQRQRAQYVTSVAGDSRGFVRVGGVCVGRLISEQDRVYFEVKDRANIRNERRGSEFVRVSLDDLLSELDRISKLVL